MKHYTPLRRLELLPMPDDDEFGWPEYPDPCTASEPYTDESYWLEQAAEHACPQIPGNY